MPESHSFTSVHYQQGKSFNIRQFLGLYCLSKLIIRLTHNVLLISLLFRFVSSLNQFHLPLLMINKVNVALLRQFLGMYCLSKLIIWLTHDVFLTSLLFRFVYSLNHIHLYCLSKLIIWLTHNGFSISLLFRFFFSLNHILVPLFIVNKVNLTILRQFLGLYCLSKLIIRLTHDVFSISLLFRIVSSLNHIHVPLFMINKVKLTILRPVSRLELSIQAYYKVDLRCFLNIIITYDRF